MPAILLRSETGGERLFHLAEVRTYVLYQDRLWCLQAGAKDPALVYREVSIARLSDDGLLPRPDDLTPEP